MDLSNISNGLLVLTSIGATFVTFGCGYLLMVPTKKSRAEATNRILNKRVFASAEKVKNELNDYFVTVINHLTKANICFYFAFVIFSTTATSFNPNISIFQAMVRIIPLALIPCLISTVAKIQVKNLQWNCFDKLNKEN